MRRWDSRDFSKVHLKIRNMFYMSRKCVASVVVTR